MGINWHSVQSKNRQGKWNYLPLNTFPLMAIELPWGSQSRCRRYNRRHVKKEIFKRGFPSWKRYKNPRSFVSIFPKAEDNFLPHLVSNCIFPISIRPDVTVACYNLVLTTFRLIHFAPLIKRCLSISYRYSQYSKPLIKLPKYRKYLPRHSPIY